MESSRVYETSSCQADSLPGQPGSTSSIIATENQWGDVSVAAPGMVPTLHKVVSPTCSGVSAPLLPILVGLFFVPSVLPRRFAAPIGYMGDRHWQEGAIRDWQYCYFFHRVASSGKVSVSWCWHSPQVSDPLVFHCCILILGLFAARMDTDGAACCP